MLVSLQSLPAPLTLAVMQFPLVALAAVLPLSSQERTGHAQHDDIRRRARGTEHHDPRARRRHSLSIAASLSPALNHQQRCK